MKRLRSVNIAWLLLVFTAVVVPILTGGLFASLSLLQSIIVSEVIYVTVAVITVMIGDRSLIGEIQQAKMSIKTTVLVLLVGVLMQPLVTWLNVFSMLFVRNYVTDTMSVASSGSLVFNLLYIALAPAVAEEFIYRGIFYHGYRRLGVLKAACLSGVLFGLMHLNWNQFVYAFALGVILALIVEATGSIYSSMIIHFMINARSVILLALINASSSTSSVTMTNEMTHSQLVSSLLALTPVALICAVAVFFAVRKMARMCGRKHFFDLAVQGQEQTVKSRKQGSEREVQESKERARQAARQVMREGTDLQKSNIEECPAEQVAKYASEQCTEWKEAGLRQKFLVMLPVIIGVIVCVGYMFWVECH